MPKSLSSRFASRWAMAEGTAVPSVLGFLEAHPRASPGEVAEVLLVDLEQRHRTGRAWPVEEYLAARPDVAAESSLAVALAVREFTIRRDRGDGPTVQRYLERFPDLADSLRSELVGAAEDEPPLGRFGDYDLHEELGRGSMGVVFRGVQRSTGRTVAVKLKRVDFDRFQTSARATAGLDHPGVVPMFEVGERDGRPYCSMEYVEGRSLREEIEGGPLDPRRAAKLIRSVALALAYAHDAGVVHRDVKPANIVLDARDHPRLLDFGLARIDDGRDGRTMTGDLVGTPAYVAPEQLQGRLDLVGPRSDVYAAGATLYRMLVGHPPFDATSLQDLVNAVVNEEPVPPSLLNADVPDDLQTICLKCLEKDPEERYESAISLADDLGRFLAGEPVEATLPIQFLRRWGRWWKRSWRQPSTIVAAVALALAVILAVMLLTSTGR